MLNKLILRKSKSPSKNLKLEQIDEELIDESIRIVAKHIKKDISSINTHQNEYTSISEQESIPTPLTLLR